MTSCDGSVLIFRSDSADEPEPAALPESEDYLRARENAERAAAKSSRGMARAVHQELAQMYAGRRRRSQKSAARH